MERNTENSSGIYPLDVSGLMLHMFSSPISSTAL